MTTAQALWRFLDRLQTFAPKTRSGHPYVTGMAASAESGSAGGELSEGSEASGLEADRS